LTQEDVKSDRTQDPIVGISGRIELMTGKTGFSVSLNSVICIRYNFSKSGESIMQITAIKRGQTLEFSELLDIPEGQAVRIEIIDTPINQDKGKFGENLEEFRLRYNIAELDIDIDAIFGDVRDKSPGREVNL
jgi:hypothetical protein